MFGGDLEAERDLPPPFNPPRPSPDLPLVPVRARPLPAPLAAEGLDWRCQPKFAPDTDDAVSSSKAPSRFLLEEPPEAEASGWRGRLAEDSACSDYDLAG